jgi:hypothetical protein
VPNPANPNDISVGEGYGVAVDPRNGQPYGSNGLRDPATQAITSPGGVAAYSGR